MHIPEDQAAILAKLSAADVPAIAESAVSQLESAVPESAPPSDRSLAVLSVLLTAARAPPADSTLLRAALQSASVPAAVLEPLLTVAADLRPRVRRALLSGEPQQQQLTGLSWRLAAVVGSRALPAQLQPELELRLRLSQQPHELPLLLEPADLRHVTAELELALSRRPAALRHRTGAGTAPGRHV